MKTTITSILFFCALFFSLAQKAVNTNSVLAGPQAERFMEETAAGFEENKGQIVDENNRAVPDVLYRFEASGIDVYLTKNGFTYVFVKAEHRHGGEMQELNARFSRVDVDLEGADIKKENILQEYPLETSFNYFSGNNPSGITGVRKYRKVTFKNIYPGIDWVWKVSTIKEKNIKYDFVVHPGADPAQIQMMYKWCDIKNVSPEELLIETPVGKITEGRALSYSGATEVSTRYKVEKNKVTFELGDYDHAQTLIIDPPLNLMWGTYFGGNAWEKNTDISNAIDANGNVFVAGSTLSGSSFPTLNPGGGTYFQGTYGGGGGIQGHGGDICILKFSNTGVLIWCTYFGGNNHDNGKSIEVSPTGDVYVVGSSLSTNFPVQSLTGAYNQGYNGGTGVNGEGGDAIILKFTNAGALLWSTFYGGAANEVARSVEVDPAGNVFMTGWTTSTDFPTINAGGTSYFQGSNGGLKDIFYVKLNNAGVQQWSTYYGGSGDELANYITLDNANNIFVTGETSSSNFPTLNPGNGAYFQSTNGGTKDIFIYKASNNGTSIWATYYGGSANDVGYGIDCKMNSDVFVTGETASTDFPLLNSGSGAFFQGTKGGTIDAFFAGFQNNGVHLWATYYGGNGIDRSCAILTDECGNTYATGHTFSTDLTTFNPGGGAYYIPAKLNTDDCFFISFNNLNVLQWATYNGTTGFDEKGTSLKVDQNGNVFVVGYWCFYSLSNGAFNPGGGAYYKGNTDADDFFILKFQGVTCEPCSFNAGGTFNCPSTGGTSFSLTTTDLSGFGSTPNFTWTGPSTFTSNLANPVFPNGLFGTYTVVGGDGACSFTALVTLVNNSLAPVANKSLDITCIANGVVYATPTVTALYNYSWQGPGVVGSPNSQAVSVNAPGNYTVTLTNTLTGCALKSSIAVVTDTNFPVISVTPTLQNITCISGVATFTGTAVSPSINVTHYWTSPFSQVPQVNTGDISLYAPTIPGIYTLCVINNENGCSACKTVTVMSSSGFPTFSLTNNTNYTVGCVPKHTTTISITNVITIVPGTGVQYAILSPTFAGGPYPYTTNSTFSMSMPGGYTVVVKDNNNSCESKIPITILQNTFTPQLSIQVPTQILSCAIPKVKLVGHSTTNNVSYSWAFPGVPGNLVSDTMPVDVTINITNTLIANYTLTITDMGNSCISRSVVPMYQNLYRPKAAVASATSISCKTPTVTLTNISSSGILPNPVFPIIAPVVASKWEGPTPEAPKFNSTTYVGSTPGVYTMTAKDLNNGCTSTATINIIDDRDFPIINVPDAPKPFILDCGAKSTVIFPLIGNSSTAGFTYYWYTAPNATVACATCSALTTNLTGTYHIVVTNTLNGCIGEGELIVINGDLKSDFEPDKYSGWAPMEVRFSNTSASSLNSTSITSVWNFGNGTSLVTDKSHQVQQTLYTQPGTYSVTLYTVKGDCIDTTMKLIHVEAPSRLEVPNVFTPNGDGVNDLFFLRSANLSTITISIVDRWGHIVYDLDAKNIISWDGKNQAGKEVAAGVYYYILKAVGADGAKFEQNGTITLIR